MKPIKFLKQSLAQVETQLEHDLTGSGPLIKALKKVFASGGKRLRPALLIICAGKADERIIKAAAGIEMIHVGSLIHDDIIDSAETRRGIQAIHRSFGTNLAIAAGDFLFSRAFAVFSQTCSQENCRLMAKTMSEMSSGEIIGLSGLAIRQTEEQYFQYVYNKTASLFGACCRLGADLGGATPQEAQLSQELGVQMGIAFQLWDDILDLEGSVVQLGKPAQADLKEGKFTLPYILALNKPGNEIIYKAAEKQEEDYFAEAAEFVIKSGALKDAKERAAHMFREVESKADQIALGITREGIIMILERLRNRKN